MSNTADEKTYALFNTALNKNIINRLNDRAAKFFLFPPLAIQMPPLDGLTTALLKNINAFNWVIFTDVLAVDCFLQRLTENDVDFFELDAVRVCAFGEAVADRLRFDQIHADLIPHNLKKDSVFLNITDYVGENSLFNLKMLIVKEESFNFELSDLLAGENAELAVCNIYQAQISDVSTITKLKTLIRGGAIDEFIFSAPEDLIAVRHFFPADQELIEIFSEIKMSAVDQNIFQTLRENGFKSHYFLDNQEVSPKN